MKSYVSAYAKDKIKKLLAAEIIKPEQKKRLKVEIMRAAALYERGIITIDEAILLIAKV